MTLSSPDMLRPLARLNAGKAYAQQIKPFNFILSCHVAKLGHPTDADPERFHLIAPYERDPRKWLALSWIDQYSGRQYRISTTLATSTKQIARVKSYGEVLEEYEFHEEAKCADASGAPCGKQTMGLLQRRHVKVDAVKFIGKESNKLEEVEEGSVPDAGDVYTEYPDPGREHDDWRKAVSRLRTMTKNQLQELEKWSGISLTTLKAWRRGRPPHSKNRIKLSSSLRNKR